MRISKVSDPPHSPSSHAVIHQSKDDMNKKQYTNWKSPKDIAKDIGPAVTKEQRTSTITLVCEEVNHLNVKKHNDEVKAKVPQALLKHLFYVLSHKGKNAELKTICEALEKVYGCSDECAEKSFGLVGSDLLLLLVHVLKVSAKTIASTPQEDEALCSVLNILTRFRRINSAMVVMVNQPGLFSALLNVMNGNVKEQVKEIAARLIASLAFHSDNSLQMLSHAGLFDTFVHVMLNTSTTSYAMVATAALLNLSATGATEIANSANIGKLYDALSLRMKGEDMTMRQFALGIIRNLAKVHKIRMSLITHNEGAILGELVTCSCDFTDCLRHKANGVIRLLVCSETAEQMGNCPHLLANLSHVASNDEINDIRAMAAVALRNLSEHILATMPCHKALLDALSKACSSTLAGKLASSTSSNNAEIQSIILDSMLKQVSVQKNRAAMVTHAGILENIDTISSKGEVESVSKVGKMLIACTVARNRKDFVNEDTLRSLVRIGSLSGQKSIVLEKFIIQSLWELSLYKKNINTMIACKGLMEYLLVCFRRNEDIEVKLMLSKTMEVLARSWRKCKDDF